MAAAIGSASMSSEYAARRLASAGRSLPDCAASQARPSKTCFFVAISRRMPTADAEGTVPKLKVPKGVPLVETPDGLPLRWRVGGRSSVGSAGWA